jgi:uncharacterized protein (TIGR02246 family)
MTDPQAAVRDTIAAINTAWLEHRVDAMAPHFREDIVFNAPGFTSRLEGREACLDSYRQFLDVARLISFAADEPEVDVFGDTAIATTAWSTRYELDGHLHDETGRDVFVFVRDGGDWKASWRFMHVDEPA